MRNETRRLYNAYLDQVAKLNGVESAAEKFTVEPSVQQTLETKIQESSEFLGRVNMVGVAEQMGDKIGLGVSGPIASTTNTTTTDRATRDVTVMDEQGYVCTQTNFDTHLTYAKIDAWAKFQDFQTRIRDAILRRQALDRIMIGFNGTSRQATSDFGTNQLLQDVNIGWLQKYRTHASDRVLAEVVAESGKVTVGATGDYKNLDALVFDAINNMIEPWYQEDGGLVAIMSRDLLADKYFPLINTANPPSEQAALDMVISQKRVGGVQAVRVPYMPAGKIFITSLENLSIYWQEGARRRTVVDNAKRDRIENYESSNEAYVIEDYGFGCLVENIELV
ncbi:Phage P2 major capsid gpN-like protein [Thauera humireducens]|jgi:P2 family phage major capsid protein|uniref:phage major capsid protein, P2 family n=1 Tax=Thauera humireducens TaxID=1134435 RepID=UPI002467A9CF|nr:phage major capsid protein, P2 family [Thauera humireducens]CAH1747920.1 Phage P2 major capsid gpN-like protein [Thauera humireducens]